MTAQLLAVLLVFYILGLYIYRMFFDHLSHIPGPKLAAASLWYEFYYDVVEKGQYTFEIGRMHEKYGMYCLIQKKKTESLAHCFLPGPIVRISPYEIHINDPE